MAYKIKIIETGSWWEAEGLPSSYEGSKLSLAEVAALQPKPSSLEQSDQSRSRGWPGPPLDEWRAGILARAGYRPRLHGVYNFDVHRLAARWEFVPAG